MKQTLEIQDSVKKDVNEDAPVVQFEDFPFIDRASELNDLDSRLEQSLKGNGALVFLKGEAGVGKTRLAIEVVKHAKEMGFRCLVAKCKSDVRTHLYFPWIEFIRQFSQQASAQLFFKVCGEYTDQVVRLVPELFESTRPQATSQLFARSRSEKSAEQDPALIERKLPEDIQREETRFLFALTMVFLRLSQDSPLLLVLDDMQWCDDASHKVVNALLRNNFAKTRMLLLCLYREADLAEVANPTVTQFFRDLEQRGSSNSIRLHRFSQDNVSELVKRVFSSNSDNRDFEALLYSKTGGNPLFIGETLKSLAESKVIFKDETGVWTYPRHLDKLHLPLTIKNVIEQRLERLDAPAVETLQIASVIGEEFNFEILRKVADPVAYGDSLLQSSLERASQSGVVLDTVSSTGKSGYMFSDESVRDVLYEKIESDKKRQYHLLTAQALEELYFGHEGGLDKRHFGEVANHYLKGGKLDKAQEYFVDAGKRASELYAHSESYASYQAAIKILENSEKSDALLRADLLKRMGDEAQFLPQYDRVLDCWEKAAKLYESCGQQLKAADTYVKLGMFYHLVMYDLENSDEMLQKAVELAMEDMSTPSEELARITAWSFIADIWKGERQKVIDKSAIALRLAKESEAHDVIAMVSSYGIAANLVGEINESIESCNRGLKISHEHGLMWEASYNYFHRAASHNYTFGPSRKSLDLFLEGLDFTAKRGNFMVNLFHKVELAYGVYLPLGEWTKAREMASESLRSVEGFPPSSLFRLISESAMGQVLLHEGNLDEAERYLEHVRKATKGFGVLQLDVPLYIALARLNMEKRDFGKAEKNLHEGYRLSKQRGLTVVNGIPHMQLLSLMVEFELLKGSEGAENERFLNDTLEEMSESSKKIKQEWTHAYVYRSKGLIARHRGDTEDSLSVLQKSSEVFEKLGWPYEHAKTQYQLGLSILGRGKLLSASKLFESSAQIFSRLGAKRDLETVESMRGQIKELGIPVLEDCPQLESKESELILENLISEFVQDFFSKKLEVGRCGWRSLHELGRNANLSKYALYGRTGGMSGPIMKELVSKGLVETRMFAGERGRGGEIMKMRVSRSQPQTIG